MKSSKSLIMGRNTIEELLKADSTRITTVYTCQKSQKNSLHSQLVENNIPIIETSQKKLSEMVNSESHQSYVASVRPRNYWGVKAFLGQAEEKQHSIVLMLDSIYDPQNLGALLRTAECFSADLVVFSKNRGTDITPVATKTSSGASELIPLAKVSNLAETVRTFKESGFWVVGAEVGKEAQNLYEFSFPEKTLLIMGSEGKGLQPILQKQCDFSVYIPMLGNIDSLNVSQATAVLFSYYRSQYTN